ncbi:MAG TPA: hypothetical protein VGI71_05790 [Scandinavium sp.]|jgi:predicted acylesterase/phospholipase RssA
MSETASAISSDPNPKECDLVMKGGITSGVVYPLAIVEIAKAFQLRSIGGTSAGAIAAAGAAAAEAGRQRKRKGLLSASSQCRDFQQLEKLPQYLASPGPSGTTSGLQGMFRAAPRLDRLFNSLIAALGIESTRAKFRSISKCLLVESVFPLIIGALLWTLPLCISLGHRLTLASSIWILVGGLFCGVLLSALVLAVRILHVLHDNRFGLCSGMPQKGDSDAVASQCLTVWLAHYLDELSGQADTQDIPSKKPLTFGDLEAMGIDLQMMTTCISHGRPYRLPFRDEVNTRENKQFFYKQQDFRELFPAYVVDWMVTHQRPASRRDENSTEDDFCRLPDPKDLPVVVAARMSLSFPILLSAIPLYAKDYQQSSGSLERCWFSDGGLTANFPIHFFDAPLPKRPTFGLDLGKVQQPDKPRVFFPANNGDALQYDWNRFERPSRLGSLTGFVRALINTMQSWGYETQARLPGYRDRIAVILLTEQEGGLNLSMPANRILTLADYGKEAGIGFVRRFGDCSHLPGVQPANTMNWENHQLIRLHSLIASISEMLLSLKQGDDALKMNLKQRYERFFTPQDLGPASYRFQGRTKSHIPGQPYQSQARLAEYILNDLLTLASEIEASNSSANPERKAPKPSPEMKLKPRI